MARQIGYAQCDNSRIFGSRPTLADYCYIVKQIFIVNKATQARGAAASFAPTSGREMHLAARALAEVNLRIVDPDQQPISEHIVIAFAQVSPSERQPEAARIPEVVSEMRDIATASDIERVIVTSLEEILVIIEDLDRGVTCNVRGAGSREGRAISRLLS
jgi:hypothetical protein